MNPFNDLPPEMQRQLTQLSLSGVVGAFVGAVFFPERSWQRALFRGVASTMSAIFLGGGFAHLILSVLDIGEYAYLASGFLMGTSAELFVRKIQSRVARAET